MKRPGFLRRGISQYRWVAVAIALAAVASAVWLLYPDSSSLSSIADSSSSQSNWTTAAASQNLALMAQSVAPPGSSKHVVYPYSIVPGGVQSAEDLRKAGEKDRVVAGHYAGFDYHRAVVVPVIDPKPVYLSYRMKDKIYWTKKRVKLHKGEYVLTDGKITARTRCANQVSEVAKPETSPMEPPASVFEDPMADGDGTAMQVPNNFASALLTRPGLDGLGPGAPPNGASGLYAPGGGGYYPGILPPGLPGGNAKGHKPKPPTPPPNPPPPNPPPPNPPPGPPSVVVPEPGTLVLISSGLAGIFWRFRKLGVKK